MHVFRHSQVEEWIVAGPAGALYGEHVLRQGLVARRVELLARGIVRRDNAFEPRSAELACLQLEEKLVAGIDTDFVAIHFARFRETAIHDAGYGKRTLDRFHELR